MTISLQKFFAGRADPKRGVTNAYAMPSMFLSDVFRLQQGGLYTEADEFEPAYQRMVGSSLLASPKDRQSFIYRADAGAATDIPGRAAYISVTNFSEGFTARAKRHGAAITVNGTAFYESQLDKDRTLFAVKGYFSNDGETFYIHRLQSPRFEARHHTGADEMYVLRDHDVMTTLAFTREIANQIFKEGRTSNAPYSIWQEQAEKHYHGQRPVWQTRLLPDLKKRDRTL